MKMRQLRAYLLALAALALPAAAAAADGASRSFATWIAVCDNVRHCEAFGLGADDSVMAPYVHVRIDAGPAARPTVAIGRGDDDGRAPAVLRVKGNGANLRLGPLRRPADGREIALSASDGRALLAAVLRGEELRVEGAGRSVPLRGATAALLWIDDRQGRAGTVTALARPGARPASGVPPAAPLPIVAAAPRGAVRELHGAPPASLQRARATCRDLNMGSASNEAEGYRLGRRQLWLIPCGAGAYNYTSALYLTEADGTNARPLPLPGPQMPASETGGRTELVNAGVDPATGRLSAFAKARGLADCGDARTWVWTGRAFALIEERVMGECKGVAPDDWPPAYRARVRD